MPVPSSIARVLDAALAERPDAEALVAVGGRLTYQELDRLADIVAAGLHTRGLRPGDRVAVTLPNDLDIVVAFHAVMRLGAIWVGVNANLAEPEARFLIEDSGASLVLDATSVAPGDLVAGAQAWAGPDARMPDVEVGPDTPAVYAYTSGTTGRPKPVVHSHHNLLVPGAVLAATRGYGPDLRKGDCLPLTIANLLVLTTLLTAQAQGCCVLIDRMDGPGIAEWIERERVTVWNGVPTILSSMAADPSIPAESLATLAEVWTGGDACPVPIRDAVRERFGLELVSTYGLTEAPTVVAIDDPTEAGESVVASGRPLPHLEVRIRDVHGAEVAPGDVGEICVAPASDGPFAGWYRLMLGYEGHPEATVEAIGQGELRTGDLGLIDPDGRLVVKGRSKAVIIRGGANVYPAEVERALLEVDGVRAAVVFAIPDERLGERVAAAVELDDTTIDPEALRDHCGAELARYKVPDHVVVVGQLPCNAMGKVVRGELPALVEVVHDG